MPRKQAPRIPAAVLERLERRGTGAERKRYLFDPVTGQRYTQYAYQKSQNFGLTPAQAAHVRREGKFDELQRHFKKRRDAAGDLLNRAAVTTGKTKLELLRSPDFWRQVRNLRTKGRKPGTLKAASLLYFGYIDDVEEYDY